MTKHTDSTPNAGNSGSKANRGPETGAVPAVPVNHGNTVPQADLGYIRKQLAWLKGGA